MSITETLVAQLAPLGEEYAAFIETLSDEAFHRRPAPEEWTAAELTGHVAEFQETFSTQALKMAGNPGLPLGRTLDDPGRLAAVARLAGAGPRDAATAVREGNRRAIETIRQISPDGWQAPGHHRVLGDVTAQRVVEQFVIAHLRTHLEQARKTVGA